MGIGDVSQANHLLLFPQFSFADNTHLHKPAPATCQCEQPWLSASKFGRRGGSTRCERATANKGFRSGDSPFSVRRSRNSGLHAPWDALSPSGQESRDSGQDSGRFQPLCGVSDLWVARSGTMPQFKSAPSLSMSSVGQREGDLKPSYWKPLRSRVEARFPSKRVP